MPRNMSGETIQACTNACVANRESTKVTPLNTMIEGQLMVEGHDNHRACCCSDDNCTFTVQKSPVGWLHIKVS